MSMAASMRLACRTGWKAELIDTYRRCVMKIYLSYTREDKDRAVKVARAFESLGHSVFVDFDLLPGDDFSALVQDRIETSDLVAVLWSQGSINSSWVKQEATIAADTKKYLGILLEPVEIPLLFRLYQHLDFNNVADDDMIALLSRALPNAERRSSTNKRRPARMEQSREAFEPSAQNHSPPTAQQQNQTPAPIQPGGTPRPFDVFISYSRKDEAACKALFDLLVQRGLNPWYDKDIGSGAFKQKIFERISSVSVFTLLLSRNSTASQNVSKELSMASQAGRLIVPISIDGIQASDLRDTFAFELVELNIFPISSEPASWTTVVDTIEASVRELSQVALLSPLSVSAAASATIPERANGTALGWVLLALIVASAQLGAVGFGAYRALGLSLEQSALAAALASIIVFPLIAATAALCCVAFGRSSDG